MKKPQLLQLLFFLFQCSSRTETLSSSTYKAAVFEHLDPSDASRTLDVIMLDSVSLYEQQISNAASQGVELIVFPEYGITGLSTPTSRPDIRPFLQVLPSVIPDPQHMWNPCLQPPYDSFNITILRRLSCAALTNSVTVVANMGSQVLCNSSDSSCPSDGVYQFNTDVVFAKNGTILTTYHKVNLYFEPVFDRPPYPPSYVSTFSTETATFGLITCFDILWEYPLITMVRERGIQQVLMPTAWTDGLPFLTSVQSQEAWAIGLHINIIAANIKKSENGYRGSGMYSGSKGYLNYTYDTAAENRLIVSEIPIIPNQQAPKIGPISSQKFTDYNGIIYDDLSNYTFRSLNASRVQGNASLLVGNLSCSVSYMFDKAVDVGDYFLAGYQGRITLGYGSYVLAVEVCSILWCWNPHDPVHTCAKPSPVVSSANLTQMVLTANFSTGYVYPNIIRDDLQLVDAEKWSFNKQVMTSEERIVARIETANDFSDRILVASLYGRTYDLDN